MSYLMMRFKNWAKNEPKILLECIFTPILLIKCPFLAQIESLSVI